jgi:hypothetical protein
MMKMGRAVADQSVLLLLEFLPATQVRANQALIDIPIPGVETFGNYPILQLGAVLIAFAVTVAGILGWKKGEKLGKDRAAEVTVNTGPPVAELHFDGPIKATFDALSDIKARQLLMRLEIKDDLAVLLSGSRNTIIDRLTALQADLRDCIHDSLRDGNNATENRVRDLAGNINSLHERVDELIRNQSTIMSQLAIRKTGRG